MKKTILISTVLALILITQAQAQLPWWLDEVEVLPPNPTSSDVVHITLSGLWGDSCIPNDSNTVITANDVYFDVIRDYPWPVYCSAVLMGWARAEAIGPLPAGTYTVHACLMKCDSSFSFPPLPCVPVEPYTPVGEFTVTATTYYVDAADGNDSNDGLTAETAFATIQKGIDTALDGDTVIVQPGFYPENIDFLGKNITAESIEPANWDVVRGTTIGDDYEFASEATVTFRGTEGANCVLAGFNVNGFIKGFDRSIDPNGDNHTHATITNCLLEDNRTVCEPLIEACDGTIRNCVIAGLISVCDALVPAIQGCDALIKNCTIANNDYALHVRSGQTCTIENSIVCIGLHHSSVAAGGTLNVRYSDFFAQEIPAIFCPEGCTINWGPGNIDVDPCFAGPANADYHLQSAAGRWDPNTESWVIDSHTSLCIDAGNPGCPLGDEPNDANNVRRNMGAYGGTAEASKGPANWGLLADLTNDRIVHYGDLGVFADYWLEAGECIPADLGRDQFVDGIDYALFALQWLNTTSSEPGMTYQIGECDFGATDANSDEPRFSVWVEGNYIHFEDMMYANCCPEELQLEMLVEGSAITIHELEYTPIPCDCMCYFPITARLGPFEDGIYTVEVFDNYGQSLGVVQVVIGGSAAPGMAYQIGDCSFEGAGVVAAAQAEETRFTVTVEGQYIHFEDTMVANCCPEELGLEMVVEDNLITVFEIEYTPGGCWCICDYPIHATLGPFEPGTYTSAASSEAQASL
ncbi:MAG: right-handed parallel beta-helix repeat-containing protein [Planctomycetota bacterium]|jgi:hypothetical protein